MTWKWIIIVLRWKGKNKIKIMKKYIIILSVVLILGLSGCGQNPNGQDVRETQHDSNIDEEETSRVDNLNEFDLSDEEIRILCETYLQEERIAQGKLYQYQQEQLYRLRFATSYLKEKYPDKKMVIRRCSEKADSQGNWIFPFYDDTDENGNFHVYVKDVSAGEYSATDDYWEDNLEELYDGWLSGELAVLLGQPVVTSTTFFGNNDFSQVTTIEEIKKLGDKIQRSTDIRVNSVADAETIMTKVRKFALENNLYGSYFLYEGESYQELSSFQTWN